jgi:colanic acid biosynthesis glycosyl transferase WcaI
MSQNRSILILTEHYWPENFRVNDLARNLSLDGVSVTVLTGFPNYPKGKIYDEYRGLFFKREIRDNIDIIRIPIIPRGNGGVIMLIVNYASFVFSASIWLIFFSKKKYTNIFVFETSPITVALPAIFYKKIRSKNSLIAMWVLDLWPDYAFESLKLKSKILKYGITSICYFIYRNLDYALCQSRTYCGKIKKYFNGEIVYLPNWAEEIFEGSSHLSLPCNDSEEKVILFAGNVGELQNLECLVKAVSILHNRTKLDNRLKVKIVGDGRFLSNIKKQVIEYELIHLFEFIGEMPLDSMPQFYASADILYISLIGSPVFNSTVPGKLQSYMAFGRPILGCIGGEAAEIINNSRSGIVVEPNDHFSLSKAIETLLETDVQKLEMMSKNARSFYFHEYSRVNSISLIKKIFKIK